MINRSFGEIFLIFEGYYCFRNFIFLIDIYEENDASSCKERKINNM